MASLFNKASHSSNAKGKRKASDAEIASEDVVASDVVAPRRNKQRVLLLPSRGVTMRMRHLVNDIEALLPHAKKDSKLDSKSNLHILNELAELNNCNNTLYFEARKAEDLYLWASKTPNGPSAKMHVQNIHTMDELKMTGNCLKGSRPLLSFDKAFDQRPHWALLKEMFTQVGSRSPSLICCSKLTFSARCLGCQGQHEESSLSSTTSFRSPSLTIKSGSATIRSSRRTRVW